MTAQEKAALVSGTDFMYTNPIPRLGVPGLCMSDGPHGLRKQIGSGDNGVSQSEPSTAFPTAACTASGWNPENLKKMGAAIAEECRYYGVHTLLGPGVNIKRNPLCGRNFEYFSEDPYLAGKMAASYVRGIQSQGVYSCIKHFAVNSQEERRMAMDAVVDERTLREIYLTGFEIAVKDGGAKSIMTSYNMVNGTYANESEHLLKDILRGEWGYDGIVITDWGGSNDHVAGVKAGSDLEMPAPGLGSARLIVDAVKNGSLKEEDLDACVDDLLKAVLDTAEKAKGHADSFDVEAHHAIARKAATESAVLLKNNNNVLPLKKGTKVAVVGDFAFKPRYQGAGSSVVNTTKLETIEELIKNEKDLSVVGMARGYQRNDTPDEELKKEAVALVKNADYVLFFFGLDEISESEGLDRKHMRLPKNQVELLAAMAKENPNIIGIISAGSSVEANWEENLQAILHTYLTGQAGAGAVLDLLTGRKNPGGKLAETYPMKYEDVSSAPYYPAKERTSEYREGIYVGYRYFDKAKMQVRYPFGYGLSYTSFEYSDLVVNNDGVTFKITNTGSVDGAEIAQMYVSLPGAKIFRPEKELKGFKKIFLKAGESREVVIPFDERTFRYFNVKVNRWAIVMTAHRHITDIMFR